jgi:NTE family protein
VRRVLPPDGPRADLVCEGGGVKGIALAGAVAALADAGYAFPRVAGSSAGAVVGCLVAALQRAGEPLQRLEDVVRAVDYRRFRDRGGLGRLPLVGRGLALLLEDGLYEGRYLEDFLTGALGDLGVRTFGDLALDPADPAADGLPAGRAYALVVTVSDLSRRRLARLPWDLPTYGADPDEAPVARAVRASAAIPFFFQPVRQPTPAGPATWVDGGLLSGFPVELFDRADALEPRWPTFGVRLTTRPPTPPATPPVRGPLALGLAALDTLLTDQGSSYLEDPCTVDRTVFVPTSGVSVVDFDLDAAAQDRLYRSGRRAAQEFLQRWDFAGHVRQCRRGGEALPPA